MPITKLTEFSGQAEVLGRLVHVEWSEDRALVIDSLDLAEAERALNLLSLGKVAGVKLPEAQPQPKTLEHVKEVAREMNETLAAIPPPAKPATAASDGKKDEPPAPAKSNGKLDEKVAVKVDAGPLHNMTSLGEVVVYLYEKGITTPEALVAECTAMKDAVPILSRIPVPNIDERVRRAFEIKGLGQSQPK